MIAVTSKRRPIMRTQSHSGMRSLLFGTITSFLVIIFIEVCSAFAYWSRLVLPEEVYRFQFYLCRGCQTAADAPNLTAGSGSLGWDYYSPDIGWDQYVGGRRVGAKFEEACGAAFG